MPTERLLQPLVYSKQHRSPSSLTCLPTLAAKERVTWSLPLVKGGGWRTTVGASPESVIGRRSNGAACPYKPHKKSQALTLGDRHCGKTLVAVM